MTASFRIFAIRSRALEETKDLRWMDKLYSFHAFAYSFSKENSTIFF